MVQRSCLAEHRLFTRCCALNTCKANRGAKLSFTRAEWWRAGCRGAKTWECTALPLLVCQKPRNPCPASKGHTSCLLGLAGAFLGWPGKMGHFPFLSDLSGRYSPAHREQRVGSHPSSRCPSTPVQRGMSSAVGWDGGKHLIMGFSSGPAEISHHCDSSQGAAGKPGVPADVVFSSY